MADTPNLNPLIAKLQLPGRSFTLPSGAYLYENGEVDDEAKRNNGDVHIHALTAIDEINLKNPDMLFSGKSIESVLSSCVPNIKKPLELFGRDIDALMLYLRIVTYGPRFEIEAKHYCENGKEHIYEVNLEDLVRKIKRLDPTVINDAYSVTLSTGQTVVLRPTRFMDVIAALQSVDPKKKMTSEDVKEALFRNLTQVIASVDGTTDRFLIDEWLRLLPVTAVNSIADTIDKSNAWGPDFTTELVCIDCGEKFKVDLPINPVSFFSE